MSKKKNNLITPTSQFFDVLTKHGLSFSSLHSLITLDDKEFILHYLVQSNWVVVEKDIPQYTEKATALFTEINTLFKPIKRNTISIPHDKADEYNSLFPEQLLPTGKYGRCNIKEVIAAFQWFFKNYNYSWDVIMQSTGQYLAERERENWNFTRRSKYFVRKMMQDKSFESDLAEYCERTLKGTHENNSNQFVEKVV